METFCSGMKFHETRRGMNLENPTAVPTVVGDAMFRPEVKKRKHICDPIFVDVDWRGSKVGQCIRSRSAGVAVDFYWSVRRPRVSNVGLVDELVAGTLAVKEEEVPIDGGWLRAHSLREDKYLFTVVALGRIVRGRSLRMNLFWDQCRGRASRGI